MGTLETGSHRTRVLTTLWGVCTDGHALGELGCIYRGAFGMGYAVYWDGMRKRRWFENEYEADQFALTKADARVLLSWVR